MSSNLPVIEKKLLSEKFSTDVALALDLSPDDEAGIREAKKYAHSVLAQIKRTQGSGGYTDLTLADPDSIGMAIIDAANFKLQIDGRNLCYLEKRSNKVNLQINAAGYVAKIKERYPDASFNMTPVFKGDNPPKITEINGMKHCEFITSNPFGEVKDLTGIIVTIEYTNAGGKLIRDIQPVPISDLLKMKSLSKSAAWNSFPIERMKTAALKRACKWHFKQDATLQSLIDYEAEEYSDQPATSTRNNIVDNINEVTSEEIANEDPAGEEEQISPEGEVLDADFSEIPVDEEKKAELTAAGDAAAKKGVADYTSWISTLSDDDKDLVRENHPKWKEIAKAVKVAEVKEEPPVVDEVDEDAPPI